MDTIRLYGQLSYACRYDRDFIYLTVPAYVWNRLHSDYLSDSLIRVEWGVSSEMLRISTLEVTDNLGLSPHLYHQMIDIKISFRLPFGINFEVDNDWTENGF